MTNPTWYFRRKHRNEEHYDPPSTEFFAEQDVADRLVREAGQNAIDAAIGLAPVKLAFSFVIIPPSAFKPYLEGLRVHLCAQPELADSLYKLDQDVTCLLVEDFGTTGLTGPLEPSDRQQAISDEPGHRLHWFFKNFGITSKAGEKLGSFGIGKTVFPYSSEINTFFGLTCRAPRGKQPRTVLLGQAQLKEHTIDGASVNHTGYYAIHSDGHDQREIDSETEIGRFRSIFRVIRRDEPGLSVAIILPDPSLSANSIACSVVRQFFQPILKGTLSVEIRDTELSPILLNEESLEETAEALRWSGSESEGLHARFHLARWALGPGQHEKIELEKPADVTTPKLDESMLPVDRKQLQSQLMASKRLAFRLPVPVEPKRGKAEWGFVDVYMEIDTTSSRCDDLYLRDGLTLIDHAGKNARHPGLRSILEVNKPSPLAELLRASENVAHTKWRRREVPKLTNNYIRGTKKVAYVLDIVPRLLQIILTPEQEADFFTLATLIPRPAPSSLPVAADATQEDFVPNQPPTPTTQDDSDEFQPPDLPDLPPSNRQWIAEPIREGQTCGFRVRRNPRYQGELRAMQVRAAYGASGQRRFTSHRPEDFSFLAPDEITIDKRDAAIRLLGHNEFEIAPQSDEYEVSIKGFDLNLALDYSVRVLPVGQDEDEGE